MYPVACAIYRVYYMQHISAAPRSAKCISQARCIEMHRDACNRKTQRHHACTSLRLSIHFHIFIFVSIFLSIPPSSLYIYLFLFKRHDNPHGNSEILASWRSALDTFRELASALIEALGLVENLINVRRTRSVRARSLPPHLLCVRVATAFYTRFVFLLFAKHSTCLCCSTKWTREPDFPDVIISLLRSSTFLDSLVR